MISKDEKAVIHKALTDTKGNRKEAAVLLGITPAQLKTIINNNPDLMSIWSDESRAVTALEVPAEMVEAAKAAEESAAVAAKKQAAILTKGWKAIGIKDDLLDFALATQTLDDVFFNKAIDVARVGSVKQYLKVGQDIDLVREEIKAGLDSGGLDPQREMMLREHLVNLLKEQGALAAQIKGYTLIAAKVKLMQKQTEGGNGKNRPGKPGFSPLVAMKVEGNVTVRENDEQE